MTIYSTEQLIEKVRGFEREELLAVAIKVLRLPVGKELKDKLARIVMNVDQKDVVKAVCVLGNDRIVQRKSVEGLIASPIMEYVLELVMAAEDPRGPFQSKELMLLASHIKGEKAPYITVRGISQGFKNQAGLILSMAGYERVSHYDREKHKPVKAWKVKRGWEDFTAQQRAELVHATINHELGRTAPAVQVTLASFV